MRDGDDRGRHTTTARSLPLCPDGACVIDTPGLRSWQPDAIDADVDAAFDDIGVLAAGCRFHDCSHRAEPGCAMRAAVDPDRLRNYHKPLREVRHAERSKWKVLKRDAKARAKVKR